MGSVAVQTRSQVAADAPSLNVCEQSAAPNAPQTVHAAQTIAVAGRTRQRIGFIVGSSALSAILERGAQRAGNVAGRTF